MLAVNYFALTDAFITLKPNYYIILDPNLSRRSSNQLEQRNKLIEAIAKVSWKMILFVPRDISKDWLEKMKHNECVKIIKYNQTPVSGFRGISHYIYKNRWVCHYLKMFLMQQSFVQLMQDSNIFTYMEQNIHG